MNLIAAQNPLVKPVTFNDVVPKTLRKGDIIEILYSWGHNLPPGIYRLVWDQKSSCIDKLHSTPTGCIACPINNGISSGYPIGYYLAVENVFGITANPCQSIVRNFSTKRSLVECMYAGLIVGVSLDDFIYNENGIIIGVSK